MSPLPFCEKANLFYWEINLAFCLLVEGWSERQKGRPMSEIIPWIDEELARG